MTNAEVENKKLANTIAFTEKTLSKDKIRQVSKGQSEPRKAKRTRRTTSLKWQDSKTC